VAGKKKSVTPCCRYRHEFGFKSRHINKFGVTYLFCFLVFLVRLCAHKSGNTAAKKVQHQNNRFCLKNNFQNIFKEY
jgi:hypothetical protein